MKTVSRKLIIWVFVLFMVSSGTAYAGQGLLQAGPTATGPLGVFPSWYMDKNGLALEGCLDGLPNCLNTAAELADPAVGEAFYWWANADLGPGGTNGFVELGLEMAFLDATAIPFATLNNAMVFNRLRVRLTGLPRAGRYVVTHPFGRRVYVATPDPQNAGRFEVNDTVDLPGSTGLASFSGALRAPNQGPFLEQTVAPRGFIGDPNVARPVKGGTLGNSVVVTGPGGFTLKTNLFLVQGKIATNGGISGVRASYSRAANGVKTVTVDASSIGRQSIVAQMGGPVPRVLRLKAVAGQRGKYSATAAYGAARAISPCVVTNRTDASRPSVTIDPVPDKVTISQATWANGILTVQATTSDLKVPRPVLQLIDATSGAVLATKRGTINVRVRAPFKPARVFVRSSAGGTAGARVR